MKRIKAACITQTLHFMLSEKLPASMAAEQVKKDVQAYKASLARNRTQHRILREETQADGSVILEIKKQYNTSPVGSYLDE